MLVQCWATVCDADPLLKHYWIYVVKLINVNGAQRVTAVETASTLGQHKMTVADTMPHCESQLSFHSINGLSTDMCIIEPTLIHIVDL